LVVSSAYYITINRYVTRLSLLYNLPSHAPGVILAIVGLGLAIAMTEGTHFDNLHSWFGLVTLSLSVLAPALGVAADMTYQPTRDSPPFWPDVLHCKNKPSCRILFCAALSTGCCRL
jgi:hypothetical protein